MNKKKILNKNVYHLSEFLNKANSDGVMPTSDWTSGRGRYITRRSLPPGVKEFTRDDFYLPVKVKKFFNKKENSKKQKCLAYSPNKKSIGCRYGKV